MDQQKVINEQLEVFRRCVDRLSDDDAYELYALIAHKMFIVRMRLDRPRKLQGFFKQEHLDHAIEQMRKQEDERRERLTQATDMISLSPKVLQMLHDLAEQSFHKGEELKTENKSK